MSRSQLPTAFVLGATGIFLYNTFCFATLGLMPAGRTALFITLNPIVTALAPALFFKEWLGTKRWFGIGLAFVGAIVIVARGDVLSAWHDLSQSLGAGELLMLGEAILISMVPGGMLVIAGVSLTNR